MHISSAYLWAENYFTVSGSLVHENAHDSFFNEKRGGTITSRGMAVHSASLGISGECDIVEFTQCGDGIALHGREGLWSACPVEYKLGQPKINDCDRLQLTAQVMCLEEMLVCDIPRACLYYSKIRRREYVDITEDLRSKVKEYVCLMHKYYNDGYTPRVRKSPKCRECSLSDICVPRLTLCSSASEYIENSIWKGDGL